MCHHLYCWFCGHVLNWEVYRCVKTKQEISSNIKRMLLALRRIFIVMNFVVVLGGCFIVEPAFSGICTTAAMLRMPRGTLSSDKPHELGKESLRARRQ